MAKTISANIKCPACQYPVTAPFKKPNGINRSVSKFNCARCDSQFISWVTKKKGEPGVYSFEHNFQQIGEKLRELVREKMENGKRTTTKGKYMNDFGVALAWLRGGEKVCRKGWNGKGMFLFLVPGSTFKVNRAPLLGIYPEGTEINYLPHVDMKTADGSVVPWLASQSDLLASDWELLV